MKTQKISSKMDFGTWTTIANRLSDCRDSLKEINDEFRKGSYEAADYASVGVKLSELFSQGLIFDKVDKTKTLRFFCHYGNARIRVTMKASGEYVFSGVNSLHMAYSHYKV